MIAEIEEIISLFEQSGEFHPREVEIDEDSQALIVKLRTNPNKFVPRVFEGDWSEITSHPNLGPARVLRVLRGKDGVARAIMRQGRALFVYPLV